MSCYDRNKLNLVFEFWDVRVGYGALTNVQFDLSIRGAMVSMPALEQEA